MHNTISKTPYKTALLAALVTVIPFLYSNSLLDRGLLVRFTVLQIVNLLLLMLFLLRNGTLPLNTKSPLTLLYALFAVYTGVIFFTGYIYADSLFELLKTVSFLFTFLLLVRVYSFDDFKKDIPVLFSITGIVLSAWGVVGLISVLQNGKLSIPLDTYQVKTLFGHRNIFLQILFFTFPFQIYNSVISKKKLQIFVASFFSTLTLFLLLVLSNRAVWLALAAMFIETVPFFIFYRKNSSAKPLIKLVGIIVAVSVLSAFLFFNLFTNTGEAGQHLDNIVKLDRGSGKDRMELWKRTLKITEEHPLTGCGIARWKTEVLKYGNKGLVSENNITFYQRPHNDFLWITAEQGIAGGLLYLSMFVTAFVLLLKKLKSDNGSGENKLFLLVTLFEITGFFIFSLFAFPHERIVHNIFLILFFAIIVTSNKSADIRLRGYSRYIFAIIVTVFTLFSVFFAAKRIAGESLLKKAINYRIKKQYSQVVKAVNSIPLKYYPVDLTSTPVLWYKGNALYNSGDIDGALECFSQALKINPYHVHLLNDYASASVQKGNYEKAVKLYKKALKISPGFQEAALNLCAVYYNKGQIDSALSVLKSTPAEPDTARYKLFATTVFKAKIKGKGKNDDWYYKKFILWKRGEKTIKSIIFETED